MAFEKRWEAVSPRLFTANGGTDGLVTVADTTLFFVKQAVTLSDDNSLDLMLEVKAVTSATTLFVGPRRTPLRDISDISDYTTAQNATIRAPEQPRPSIPEKEHERAAYAEEPIVAKRSILVDKLGEYFDDDNPFMVAMIGAAVNVEWDEVDFTYVAAGNGVGEIEDMIFKLAAATVLTITFSYNANDEISNIAKS